mgnify:CR=1 FL=1
MMISQSMNTALNGQIANELFASMSYRQMAFEFDVMGLKVFAAKFQAQADEEHDHAMRIAKYVLDSGGNVELAALDKPQCGFKAAQPMVEAALASEVRVSKQIYGLADQAESEKDHSTRSFLKWFIDEQVEEVSTMSDLLQLVKMAGEANLVLVEQRLHDLMKTEAPAE